MALRKPLVFVNGAPQRLQSGDTLDATFEDQSVGSFVNDNAGSISQGQPVYVKSNGAVDLAQADAATTSRTYGLVFDASIATTATGKIQGDNVLTVSDWTTPTGSATLTVGSVYYLSAATAGELTTTAPSTTGQYVQKVGFAISTTKMNIDLNDPILL